MPKRAEKTAPRRLGRPPKGSEGESVARILDAAANLFLEHGYAETSIDGIAAVAGVSKKTFYDRFPSKADLFAEAALLLIERNMESVEDGSDAAVPVRDRLGAVALAVLYSALKPEIVAFDRIISAEAVRFPELARIHHELGASRVMPLVEECLRDGVERGELDIEDIRFAADYFITAAIRGPLRKAVLAVERPGFSQRHHQDLVRTIDLFLGGVARPDR